MRIWNCSLLTGCLAFVVLILIIHGSGCSPQNRIDSYTSDDGTTIDRMVGNEIGVSPPQRSGTSSRRRGPSSVCYLDAQRCRDSKGRVTYSLLSTIRYEETEELDRPAGSHANECLTLVIDGERVVLWGKGEPNREKEGLIGYDTESLSYPISAAILSKLASAYRVDVEIWSEMGTLKGFFKKENITNFRQFYAKHVEDDQSTTQKK